MFEHAKLSQYSLNEWIKEFDEIYHPINPKRSSAEIWLHVVEHAASIHEDIRTADYSGALDHLPKVFCWYCAFIKRASEAPELAISPSLEDIILNKFAGRCYYCEKERCECQSKYGARIQLDLSEKERLRQKRRVSARTRHAELVHSGDAPKTLQDFVKMFKDIFGHKNYDSPIEIIGAHFQEEIGEVCEDINEMYDKLLMGTAKSHVTREDLEDELADAFAWIAAMYWKVDYIVGSARNYVLEVPRKEFPTLGRSLEELIWAVYADKATQSYLVDPPTQARPLKIPVTSG